MIPGKDIQDMQTLQRNGRTRHTSLKKLHSDNTCLYGFPVMPISSKILLTDFHILATPVGSTRKHPYICSIEFLRTN